MNTYTVVDVAELPSRAASGGKRSEFAILDTLPENKGIHVSEDRISAARSYARSRTKADPTLRLVTRRITSGEHSGMFLIARLPSVQPTAPETPAAP